MSITLTTDGCSQQLSPRDLMEIASIACTLSIVFSNTHGLLNGRGLSALLLALPIYTLIMLMDGIGETYCCIAIGHPMDLKSEIRDGQHET